MDIGCELSVASWRFQIWRSKSGGPREVEDGVVSSMTLLAKEANKNRALMLWDVEIEK